MLPKRVAEIRGSPWGFSIDKAPIGFGGNQKVLETAEDVLNYVRATETECSTEWNLDCHNCTGSIFRSGSGGTRKGQGYVPEREDSTLHLPCLSITEWLDTLRQMIGRRWAVCVKRRRCRITANPDIGLQKRLCPVWRQPGSYRVVYRTAVRACGRTRYSPGFYLPGWVCIGISLIMAPSSLDGYAAVKQRKVLAMLPQGCQIAVVRTGRITRLAR